MLRTANTPRSPRATVDGAAVGLSMICARGSERHVLNSLRKIILGDRALANLFDHVPAQSADDFSDEKLRDSVGIPSPKIIPKS